MNPLALFSEEADRLGRPAVGSTDAVRDVRVELGGLACTPVAKRVLETYFAKYGRDGHAEAVPAPARAEPPAPAPPAEEEAGG